MAVVPHGQHDITDPANRQRTQLPCRKPSPHPYRLYNWLMFISFILFTEKSHGTFNVTQAK
jgi:hypothetical protein